jgi:DNA-binding transcriptional regulator YhcF (GntR family)
MITPTPNKRRRVRGTSLDAWKRVRKNLTAREQMVAGIVRGKKRATQRAVANSMKVPVHTISGRFSSLERKKILKEVYKIYRNGQSYTVYEMVKRLSK